MQCPKCQVVMKVLSYEGVAIEKCPACHGEWLDDGELHSVVVKRDKTFSPAVKKELLAKIKANKGKPTEITRTLKCPRCGGSTAPNNYATDSGIIIDRCTSCHGVWVDQGELEMIQVYVESFEEPL